MVWLFSLNSGAGGAVGLGPAGALKRTKVGSRRARVPAPGSGGVGLGLGGGFLKGQMTARSLGLAPIGLNGSGHLPDVPKDGVLITRLESIGHFVTPGPRFGVLRVAGQTSFLYAVVIFETLVGDDRAPK